MRTGESVLTCGRRFAIDRWNGREYYVCDVCGRRAFLSLSDAATCCGASLGDSNQLASVRGALAAPSSSCGARGRERTTNPPLPIK